ncbi:MAG: hypothetical protein Rubg2KO_01320 [Rubricoccaceae bacterium]
MSFLSRLMGTSSNSLTPAEFVRQRDLDAPLIDVRSPKEFAEGHLEGAIHANVMAPDFAQTVAALDLPTEGPIYLYCRSGNRSKTATGLLQRQGHTGAVNIGGFNALVAAGAKAA